MEDRIMGTKLQRTKPGWHDEAVALLKEHAVGIHTAFCDATKKAVWLGIFLEQIKARGKADGSIPHGEFGPWFDRNFSEFPFRTAQRYMSLARNICETGELRIEDFEGFSGDGQKCQIGAFGYGGNLPQKVLELIEGKTQQQLFLEFKQTKPGVTDNDGNLIPAAGRRQGEGGRPAAAQTIEGQEAAAKAQALRRMGIIDQELGRLGIDFILHPDALQKAFLAALDRTAKCLRANLNTAPTRRDPKAVLEIYNIV